MNERFIIPLNGLAAGENLFFWKAGKEFFDSFENSEILDAHLDADVRVEKSGRYIGVDCDVTGAVVVECDRCLDELDMPVDVEIRLSVKYGSEDSSEEQSSDREIVFIPETDAELDMSQIIYDYVCLSLPMQRVHPEGSCNPEAMKYFCSPVGCDEGAEKCDSNPFSALKDMFK
ncbi:MAG: DUF177 domain-containing protein [Bacteroidales bacterium]|nr:DUF177 domain-containing protein [Bacteroidales bacterium]